jgi:nitrogen fixation-related uncharacterized protein
MRGRLMIIAVNFVLGIMAVAGIVWDVSSGQVGSMDGNFLIVVCLLLAVIFLGVFCSSIRNGEFKQALLALRRKSLDQSKGSGA